MKYKSGIFDVNIIIITVHDHFRTVSKKLPEVCFSRRKFICSSPRHLKSALLHSMLRLATTKKK
jgi:hypothetical protein